VALNNIRRSAPELHSKDQAVTVMGTSHYHLILGKTSFITLNFSITFAIKYLKVSIYGIHISVKV